MNNAAYVKQVVGNKGVYHMMSYFFACSSILILAFRLSDISSKHPLTFANWASPIAALLPLIAYLGGLTGIRKAKAASILTAESSDFCEGLIAQVTCAAYVALQVLLTLS